MASHAGALVALLDVGDDGAAQETPFGALRPPLGLARLKVMLPTCTQSLTVALSLTLTHFGFGSALH